MNNRVNYIALSLFSGALFRLGWPVLPLPVVLFLAFVPLLIIEDYISEDHKKRKGRRFFFYTYLALLIWNISTTWWICNASVEAGIFTLIVNPLLMSIPLMLFRWTRSVTNNAVGYTSFVVYYLAFEYFHLTWDLSWPWLTLGNAFSSLPQLVQWYEYTGVFGGSLWILLVNVLLFFIWKKYHEKQSIRRWVLLSTALLAIPTALSLSRYIRYKPTGVKTQVVVVQPNIDPYTEKYSEGDTYLSTTEQVERLLKLTAKKTTDQTEFVLWPETAIPFYAFEANIDKESEVIRARNYLLQHPSLSLITGMDSRAIVSNGKSPAAHYDQYSKQYFEVYNAALFIQGNEKLRFYHKSKLVPGPEKLPYPAVFGILVKSLGVYVGTLGTQEDRVVFVNNAGKSMAPVICYESIFGDFMRGYMKNGAQAIAIITNDGWWENTEGHRQHLYYARLRAVEFRKEIARSANTGISCFINQRGDLRETTEYWQQDVRRSSLLFNKIQTPYVTIGDIIGKIAIYLAPLLILLTVVRRTIRR